MKLPEIRSFWYFLPLAVINLAICAFFLETFWFLAEVFIFFGLAAIIFINALRSGQLNLEIKTERNQMKSVVFNLLDGIIAYDQDFKILIFNRAAEHILNIGSSNIVNTYFTPDKAKDPGLSILGQIMYPSLAAVVIKRSEAGVYPQVADFVFSNPSLNLRVTTDKIFDPNGELIGFVKIINDRTRESEILKSKSEFIEVAAHQLRTPLTSINWIFESLQKEKLSGEIKDMVNMGSAATAGVLKIVNDLLDVSKIEEGRYGYNFEQIDIIKFVEEILNSLLPFAKESNVKLYLEKPQNEPVIVFVDPQKLTIALSNIIDNAIKYNVDKGEVVVGIKKLQDNPYVQITIRDTGIGINENDLKKLFTKFFRSDNAQKIIPSGTGLGLYLAKNIIKGHGGEIFAESYLNRGTTFNITLPTDSSLVPASETPFIEE